MLGLIFVPVVHAVIDETNLDRIYQFILSNPDFTVLSIEY